MLPMTSCCRNSPRGRRTYPRTISEAVFNSASFERFRGGSINIQKYFGNELRFVQIDLRKFDRFGMAINGQRGQRSIVVVVAGEMIVVRAGVVVSGARRAVAGGFGMQKTYGRFMCKGKSGLFNLMGD